VTVSVFALVPSPGSKFHFTYAGISTVLEGKAKAKAKAKAYLS
jgi:hypothetical protein